MVYEPRPGEVGIFYEMGIPVLETGDSYHVDVQQNVPLSFNRDNVPPHYLRSLRVSVPNAVYQDLPEADATAAWVQDFLLQSAKMVY
jgi:hypothetical protein